MAARARSARQAGLTPWLGLLTGVSLAVVAAIAVLSSAQAPIPDRPVNMDLDPRAPSITAPAAPVSYG